MFKHDFKNDYHSISNSAKLSGRNLIIYIVLLDLKYNKLEFYRILIHRLSRNFLCAKFNYKTVLTFGVKMSFKITITKPYAEKQIKSSVKNVIFYTFLIMHLKVLIHATRNRTHLNLLANSASSNSASMSTVSLSHRQLHIVK